MSSTVYDDAFCFFFFQAEDGIRDIGVTGVQTCALPIYHRFEAVGTVDGLDVINGKSGTLDNRGYVLLPFATLEIEGFRTSTNAVAAFRFAAVADSYAAQTGSARNVGVIGIAFFTERGDTFIPE